MLCVIYNVFESLARSLRDSLTDFANLLHEFRAKLLARFWMRISRKSRRAVACAAATSVSTDMSCRDRLLTAVRSGASQESTAVTAESQGKLDLERSARGSHHSLQVKLIRLAVARKKLERHTRTARDEPFVVEVSVGPPPQLIDLVGTQRELLAADADAD